MSSKPKIAAITPTLADLHALDAKFEQSGSNFTSTRPALAQNSTDQAMLDQPSTGHVESVRAALDQADPVETSLVPIAAPAVKRGRAPKPVDTSELSLYGSRARIVAYATPESAIELKALARELDRSESWMAGKLIQEALDARRRKK